MPTAVVSSLLSRRSRLLLPGVMLLSALVLGSGPLPAQDLRVFEDGKTPTDSRLGPLKDLNGYFPFEVPETKAEWEKRREELRRRVLVATGLWPMPEKSPLNAEVYGKSTRAGFTVEKVHFESMPGHFVTGLLFRPEGKDGVRPGILCPHGHGGRLQDYGEIGVRNLIVQGAERFEASGRYPKLARCAQLARMGCVSFIFDMEGYVDSGQLSYHLAHRFAKQRPEMESRDSWGLYSTQAEMRLQSIMGIQTWNCIRALDFLCGLPDVDAERIGVTGGSGGGTQTILLCAIDERPKVAFPQGMVSTSMQGGCTCENCSLLRIGTGNVELAALFAPRPQAMTTADDWTRDMMTKGYPQLQQLYALYGAKDNVLCRDQQQFRHNYNYVTRAMMYSWMNKHLKLGLPEPIVEEDYKPLTPEEYTVWDEEHPKPEGGDDYERQLTKYMAEQSDRQLAALAPGDEKSLEEFRRVVGGAFRTIIGRDVPAHSELTRGMVDKVKQARYIYFEDTVQLTTHDEQLPIISLYPTTARWNGKVVIWVDGQGKAGMFDENQQPRPQVLRLLDAGFSVVAADLFLQGEFLAGAAPIEQQRVVSNPREFAGYTFGYNDTLFAQRVHDILTLVAFIRGDDHKPKQLDILGVNGAGPLVAAARAIAGEAIDRAAIDTQGFRFANLTSWRDVNFLPGSVKYGDLPALLALSAPHPLWITGEDNTPALTKQAYRAAGQPENITTTPNTGNPLDAAVEWLVE